MFFPLILLTLLFVLICSFFSIKKHFLAALLLLESIVLISLLITLFVLGFESGSLYIFIMVLTLGVCEAGLGLSLLISFIKITSTDLLSSYNGIMQT
uniref:NADH dehydrogenase subunit 4L n=1 Tax=Megalophaedusa proba caryostoma TaxID=1885877 RepID=A0A224A068_9EUPU|nr:NADH dehydrogenase subunit 4L [Megalophaedusa proba caryostoma]